MDDKEILIGLLNKVINKLKKQNYKEQNRTSFDIATMADFQDNYLQEITIRFPITKKEIEVFTIKD